jgi:hypothetical protein
LTPSGRRNGRPTRPVRGSAQMAFEHEDGREPIGG